MNSAGTHMTIEEVLQYEQEHTLSRILKEKEESLVSDGGFCPDNRVRLHDLKTVCDKNGCIGILSAFDSTSSPWMVTDIRDSGTKRGIQEGLQVKSDNLIVIHSHTEEEEKTENDINVDVRLSAMSSMTVKWNILTEFERDEITTLFSAFAKKTLDRQTLWNVLDSTSNPDGHDISSDQLSKLFVTSSGNAKFSKQS